MQIQVVQQQPRQQPTVAAPVGVGLQQQVQMEVQQQMMEQQRVVQQQQQKQQERRQDEEEEKGRRRPQQADDDVNNNNNNNNDNNIDEKTTLLQAQLEHEREQILTLHSKLTSAAQAQSLEAATKLQTIITKSREEIKGAKEKYRRRWKDVQGELDHQRKIYAELKREFDEYRVRQQLTNSTSVHATSDHLHENDHDDEDEEGGVDNTLQVDMLHHSPKLVRSTNENSNSKSRKIRQVNQKL